MRIFHRFLTSLMFLFRFYPTSETASLKLRLDDLSLFSKTHDLIDFTPTSTNSRDEEESEEEKEKEEASTSLNDDLLDPNLMSAVVDDMTTMRTNNNLVFNDDSDATELCVTIAGDDNDWTDVQGRKRSRRQVCSSSSLPSLGSYDDGIDALLGPLNPIELRNLLGSLSKSAETADDNFVYGICPIALVGGPSIPVCSSGFAADEIIDFEGFRILINAELCEILTIFLL